MTHTFDLHLIFKLLSYQHKRTTQPPATAKVIRSFSERDYFSAVQYLKQFKPSKTKLRVVWYYSDESEGPCIAVTEEPLPRESV